MDDTPQPPPAPVPVHDPSPSPAVSQSRKKQKTVHVTQTPTLLALPPPPPLLKPPPNIAPPAPSPAASKRGVPVGPRGKKSKVVSFLSSQSCFSSAAFLYAKKSSSFRCIVFTIPARQCRDALLISLGPSAACGCSNNTQNAWSSTGR